jgi:hypothetical protein
VGWNDRDVTAFDTSIFIVGSFYLNSRLNIPQIDTIDGFSDRLPILCFPYPTATIEPLQFQLISETS